jgi:uncharacterized membrane protein YfcA
MISLPLTLLVMAILFCTTFTRSTLGFGDALLAMPILALVIDIRMATPLVAFVGTTTALTILLQGWRTVDLRAAWRLILASFVGIPVGLLLLKGVPEGLVKAVLGVVLMLFGLYNLARPELPALRHGGLAYLFGFIAGILGGAYNTNGPPIVMYGTLQRWSPERFRATLQGYFVPTGLLILLGHGAAGLWTPQVFWLFGCSFPLIMLGVFLGGRLNQAIPKARFERVLYFFLIGIGILLMV